MSALITLSLRSFSLPLPTVVRLCSPTPPRLVASSTSFSRFRWGQFPLQSGFYSKGCPQTLEPYSTSTFDYFFYFPEEGQYPIYPVQVASSKGHLSSGSKFVFKVVNELSVTDKTSWAWILQNGTEKEVLAYLENHNLNRIDLGLIAFRLRNENQGGGRSCFLRQAPQASRGTLCL